MSRELICRSISASNGIITRIDRQTIIDLDFDNTDILDELAENPLWANLEEKPY